MANTTNHVNYNHPNRPPLGTRPSIRLAAGESVALTGPNAGVVRRNVRTAAPTISYRKGV